MKNIILICLFLSITLTSFAQSPKYIAAMEKTLTGISGKADLEDYKKAANTFERIASAEKEEFLPSYYHAYCHMMIAVSLMRSEPAKMNEHIDQAQKSLDKAKELAKEVDESEILTMQGFIYQGRIWENPQVKGMIYSPKSTAMLQKAIEANPENPRPYYLLGQNTYYTPAMWGGGAENAKPFLVTAKEKYENAENVSSIHPTWGEGSNNYLLRKIKESEEAK